MGQAAKIVHVAGRDSVHSCSNAARLSRAVYGLLGIPIDAVDLADVVSSLDAAAVDRRPFLLSTPNLNFLVLSQTDQFLRQSLLESDLCSADGMPLVWLSRMLGIPLPGRVAGADIFDELQLRNQGRLMKVFLFGGGEGVASRVASKINRNSRSMVCVGARSPGFGSASDLSAQHYIDEINASGADLLALFLSAKKAQEWLLKNRSIIEVPLRAQFGATINFQAQTIKRAPQRLREFGLEWLWRIKEEPYLWRRYLHDGIALIAMVLTRVVPILILKRCANRRREALNVEEVGNARQTAVTLRVSGAATMANIVQLERSFTDVLNQRRNLVLDIRGMTDVDARFFGLIIVLRKLLAEHGLTCDVVNPSTSIRQLFRLHGFLYLLAEADKLKAPL
jgi:N-acetylglucosaminyldiphosphoundecaprenol N-acetyl-beta-D-mannosaminyltransferase